MTNRYKKSFTTISFITITEAQSNTAGFKLYEKRPSDAIWKSSVTNKFYTRRPNETRVKQNNLDLHWNPIRLEQSRRSLAAQAEPNVKSAYYNKIWDSPLQGFIEYRNAIWNCIPGKKVREPKHCLLKRKSYILSSIYFQVRLLYDAIS